MPSHPNALDTTDTTYTTDTTDNTSTPLGNPFQLNSNMKWRGGDADDHCNHNHYQHIHLWRRSPGNGPQMMDRNDIFDNNDINGDEESERTKINLDRLDNSDGHQASHRSRHAMCKIAQNKSSGGIKSCEVLDIALIAFDYLWLTMTANDCQREFLWS